MSSETGNPTSLGFASSTNHKRTLFLLSCTASILTLALTYTASRLPLFDSSPLVLLPSSASDTGFSLRHALASAVLRWDAFHFGHVAKGGYVYEHEWAFFPGVPYVMHFLGRIIRAGTTQPSLTETELTWEEVLLGGLLGSSLSVLSVIELYDLTLHTLGSPKVALLASLLSLLPSSPVTLRIAGYSEPFFTYLSYKGMRFCAQKRWLLAACAFSAACFFRSNGILACGFILWGIIVEPVLDRRKVHLGGILYTLVLTPLILSPFIYIQYDAYRHFCLGHSGAAPWCNAFLPSIYAHVQAKYWNVGFLRYWTLQQLPNFLLGAPPLSLLFAYTLHYAHKALVPQLQALVSSSQPVPDSPSEPKTKTNSDLSRVQSGSPFLRSSLAPHAIHALAVSLLLLFASHTQIVLRQAASMPTLYWAAAWLLVEHPTLGKWWVGWSVVWGAISCVLWGAFLPPA